MTCRRGRPPSPGTTRLAKSSGSSPAITGPRFPAGWCRRPKVGSATPASIGPRHSCPGAAPPDVPRLSPLDVSARYLSHFVQAWNHGHAKSADKKLEKQTVVLTVPASFDDVARNLTLEAAKKAGLQDVILLEEPQAAFYAWLATADAAEVERVKPEMRCPGGRCRRRHQRLQLDRSGRGKRRTRIHSSGGRRPSPARRRQHGFGPGSSGRAEVAREAGRGPIRPIDSGVPGGEGALLAPNPPASMPVTVMGRGRLVVGGTLTAQLTPADVRSILFDGFFPESPADAEPQRAGRAGLHEMGLPYVHDPAVTRHLAAFLRRHLQNSLPSPILGEGPGVREPPPRPAPSPKMGEGEKQPPPTPFPQNRERRIRRAPTPSSSTAEYSNRRLCASDSSPSCDLGTGRIGSRSS